MISLTLPILPIHQRSIINRQIFDSRVETIDLKQKIEIYPDDYIRDVAKYDIDQVSMKSKSIFDIPYLDMSHGPVPRKEALTNLGFNNSNLKHFSWALSNHVVFLTWQRV